MPKTTRHSHVRRTEHGRSVVVHQHLLSTRQARREKRPTSQLGLRERDRVQPLKVNDIIQDPDQPRKTFEKESIESLAESISAEGLIHPIVVRSIPGQPGKYQIIAGERRWRAHKYLQDKGKQAKGVGPGEIQVIVRNDLTEEERVRLQFMENFGRTEMDVIETAAGMFRMFSTFKGTDAEKITQLAESLGFDPIRKRSALENYIALHTKLDPEIREHARKLLHSEDPGTREVIGRGLDAKLYVISRLEPPEQKALWRMIQTQQMTIGEVKAQAARFKALREQEMFGLGEAGAVNKAEIERAKENKGANAVEHERDAIERFEKEMAHFFGEVMDEDGVALLPEVTHGKCRPFIELMDVLRKEARRVATLARVTCGGSVEKAIHASHARRTRNGRSLDNFYMARFYQ